MNRPDASVEGETLLSFTVLTCAAGPATRQIHPRCPFELREVGRAIGNVHNDGPELIEALDAGV